MAQEAQMPKHDIVDESEVTRLIWANRIQLRANIMGKMAVFRANTGLKLRAHNAILETPTKFMGWAIFRTNTEEGSVMTGNDKETLLFIEGLKPTDQGVLAPPLIRIITNEVIPFEGGYEIFTQDVSIDKDNDGLFFTNSVRIGEDGVLEDTLASLFVVENGKLALNSHALSGTLIQNVYDNKGGYFSPFGKCKHIDDKIYALTRATEFLHAVSDLEPTHVITAQS